MRNIFEVAASRVLDDEFASVSSYVRERIAERVTAVVLEEVERDGQAHRSLVFSELGNPHCSWCGRLGCNEDGSVGMPSTHPQYGLMCTCTEPLAKDGDQ